jgi:hypothetical protein
VYLDWRTGHIFDRPDWSDSVNSLAGRDRIHLLRFGRPRRTMTWVGRRPALLRATEGRLFAIRGGTVRILDVP